MSDYAIKALDLGKRYKIGAAQTSYRYKTIRETLIQSVKAPLERLKNPGEKSPETNILWALKDVNFEIKRGEAVGIVGRNGAGKSTLLKILSHITEPTTGRVHLRGRVGSLLEVGTGFHPELTGRENIYLSGSIMGMKRAEIIDRFDEIVAFAEVEKFLDTPVKRYSSGMYVRLAFAVAAHLQPEILLVDEVLAVGDTAFQKKCLGRMEDITKEGRTVIFVSHNMGAIETLCRKGVLLDHGCVKEIGDVHKVVASYIGMNHVEQENPFIHCNRSGNGKVRVTGFHLEDLEGNTILYATSGAPVVLAVEYETNGEKCSSVSVGISGHQINENNLFLYYSHFSDVLFSNLPQKGTIRCVIDETPLAPGNFLLMLRVLENGIEADWPKVFVPITVQIGDYFQTGTFDGHLIEWSPRFLIKGKWSLDAR